jgi:hypothetical protein
MPEETAQKQEEEEASTPRVIAGIIIALVILGGLTYAAYLYSSRKSGTVLPAGYQQNQPAAKPVTMADINCDNPDPSYKTTPNYYIKCDFYKESPDTKWSVYTNPVRGTKFEFPTDLKLTNFTNGYAYNWRTLSTSSGLAVSYDLAVSRGGVYKTMIAGDYPKNYWKQYPGLTGVKSVDAYTTIKEIKGWQAIYQYGADTPTIDTFFEDPTAPGDYIHFSKGVLSDEVYKKVLDSFEWTLKSSPTPAPKTVATPAASAAATPSI